MPLHVLAPQNISLRRLMDGNFPQIQNITKQKLYSNTQIFAFAKELLREPNVASQYIVVCVVHSLLACTAEDRKIYVLKASFSNNFLQIVDINFLPTFN